jgi:hypothetical protein
LDVLRKHAPLHANVATPEGYTTHSLSTLAAHVAASAGMIVDRRVPVAFA